MICPVCNAEGMETVCSICGFDRIKPPRTIEEHIEWMRFQTEWRHRYWATLKEFEILDEELVKYHGTSKTVAIPYGIARIGEGAFEGCKWIHDVIIPGSVMSIGDVAFRGCTALRNVVFTERIPDMGVCVFEPELCVHMFFPEGERSYSSSYRYPEWVTHYTEINWDWEMHNNHPEIVLLDEQEVKASLHDYHFDGESREFTISVHCTNQTDVERFFYLEDMRFDGVSCNILPVCRVKAHSDELIEWVITGDHLDFEGNNPRARFSFYFRVAKTERKRKHKSDIQERYTHYFPIFLGEKI